MTMLSKSRYTATRGAPGSVTVLSYHLAGRLRPDRESRQTRLTATDVTADDHYGRATRPRAVGATAEPPKKSGPDPKGLVGLGGSVDTAVGRGRNSRSVAPRDLRFGASNRQNVPSLRPNARLRGSRPP